MGSSAREFRLLAVVPHPDDEVYLLGGTLAKAAHFGASVQVAFCTRGEAGLDRSGKAPPGPALAVKRTAEAYAASEALGLERPGFLDIGRDGHLNQLDERAAIERLDQWMEERAPQVVIGLARNGVYGHRDHICCTRWLEMVMSKRAAESRLLLADAPHGLFVPVWRMLRAQARLVEPDLDPEELGVRHGLADLVVDIRDQNAVKRQALICHESQLEDENPMSFLMPGLFESLMDRELFVQASGPTLPRGATNPFEGLP